MKGLLDLGTDLSTSERALRVTFVLPAPVRVPSGGAAVVYRHARWLADRGHRVLVICPRRPGHRLRDRVFGAARHWRNRLHGVEAARPYEREGDGDVATIEPPSPSPSFFPDSDAVIATGYQTVPWVSALPESKGVPFYFIQNDERPIAGAAASTWHAPLHRIVVAQWLADSVKAEGESVLGVVPNALEQGRWGMDVDPAERGACVAALYHRFNIKGPDVLIEVLKRLFETRPDMQAEVFASRRPRRRFPGKVSVRVRPSHTALRSLYNRAAVFVHTSHVEGWGLTVMEAAACGAAVVATDSGGPSDFLTDGASMCRVPVGDVDALVKETLELLSDPVRRAAMAERAAQDIGRFSWPESSQRFEQLLRVGCERSPSTASQKSPLKEDE